jgi:hypothetical protein
VTQVKTKIWRGGLAGAALPAGASTDSATEGPPPPSSGEQSALAPALSQTRVVSPSAQAGVSQTAALPSKAEARSEATPLPTVIRPTPSPMSSTRIMPVEALLAPPVTRAAAATREEPVVLPRNPLGMRLLIAGLLVFTLGIWLAPRLLEQEPAAAALRTHVQPMQPTSTATRPVAPTAAPTATAQARSVPAPETQPRNRAHQRGEQRGAADALASGDYSQAAALYGRLAAAHPEQPAYAQAERILKQRLASGR